MYFVYCVHVNRNTNDVCWFLLLQYLVKITNVIYYYYYVIIHSYILTVYFAVDIRFLLSYTVNYCINNSC